MPDAPPKFAGPKRLQPFYTRKQRARKAETQRARQARRRYRTDDPRWRRIREAVLSRNPLCRSCEAKGEVRPAVDVDHIDGDSWNNRMDNLQGLCKPCHARKTARETGRAVNGRFRGARKA